MAPVYRWKGCRGPLATFCLACSAKPLSSGLTVPSEVDFLDLQHLLPQMASLRQPLKGLTSGIFHGAATSAATPQLKSNHVSVNYDTFNKESGQGYAPLGCREDTWGDFPVHKPLRKPSFSCNYKTLDTATPEGLVKGEKGKMCCDKKAPAPSWEGDHNARDVMATLGTFASPTTRPNTRLRLYPGVPLLAECVEEWNTILMQRVNLALAEVYRKDPRSVEISLESIGPAPNQTTPTVLVVCGAVKQVRAELLQKESHMFRPHTRYALKVCRGSLVRSRRGTAQRSMASDLDSEALVAANGGFQERPMPGASIGAWIGDKHLPPVSFGGLVVVDDKTYGMTAHHMLDEPGITAPDPIAHRSIAVRGDIDFFRRLADPAESDGGEHFTGEFSSSDSESEDDIELEEVGNAGDIPGVEPGCGYGYIVTQPALDDVEDAFFASPETQDKEHLDKFTLGRIYASSGSRRRSDDQGLVHEIDWALFEFKADRYPSTNFLPRWPPSSDLALKSVVPASSLPNLEVECLGRTTGLQTGTILLILVSVRIYGRTSPSHAYQIAGNSRLPIGLPGDSGAWVIEKTNGQVCGHILAFSQRKRVAYICPMDVLMLDIAETLQVTELRLPGGEPVVEVRSGCASETGDFDSASETGISIDDLSDLFDDSETDEVKLR